MSATPLTQDTAKNMPKKQSPLAKEAIAHYCRISEALNQATHNHVLVAKRQEAQQKLASLGLPTRRDEDWQYTPITDWLKIPFGKKIPGLVEKESFQDSLPAFETVRLVFVDGYFAEDLSSDFALMPEGLSVELGETTNAAMANSNEPFELLHDMLTDKQLRMKVKAGTVLEQPIHLVCLQSQAEHVCTRTVQLHVEDHADAVFIQHQCSLNEGNASFLNSFTQIQVGENARCQQVVIQDLNEHSFYFGSQKMQLASHARLSTLFIGLGAQLSRHNNHVYLQGEGADAQQYSLVSGRDRQVMDTRTETHHLAPHCTSNQLHKLVLDDASRGVFNGMIFVDQVAQKTDGQMDNKNLLLSREAKVDSKPQLEIYADDVKCSHGCATGEIDADQVFYCQARGLHKEAAMKLITRAFLFEPMESVSKEPVRQWLTALVSRKLGNL